MSPNLMLDISSRSIAAKLEDLKKKTDLVLFGTKCFTTESTPLPQIKYGQPVNHT